MSEKLADEDQTPFTISLIFGATGSALNFTFDPADKDKMIETLNEILRLAKAPLIAEIEALKRRTLSPNEIRHFVNLVKLYPTETRVDGKQTSDDLLILKLEELLRS